MSTRRALRPEQQSLASSASSDDVGAQAHDKGDVQAQNSFFTEAVPCWSPALITTRTTAIKGADGKWKPVVRWVGGEETWPTPGRQVSQLGLQQGVTAGLDPRLQQAVGVAVFK